MKFQPTIFSVLIFACSTVMISCGGGNQSSPHGDSAADSLATRSVHPSTAIMKDSITQLEKRTFSSDGKMDRSIAVKLLRLYQDYYNFHPDDAEAPHYLFKAADVARGMGKYKLTIDLLTNLHDGFTQYPNRDEVAFLVAFTYDANLRDTTKAIKAYGKVMELYPKSSWASEAKSNIVLLQMTEQELIQFLEDKNKPS